MKLDVDFSELWGCVKAMKGEFRIKVISSSKDEDWYSSGIGSVHTVTCYNGDLYAVVDDRVDELGVSHADKLIRISDCKMVK